ncbi:MAG: hypothetical protein ACK47B_09605 [Armatimonadota bacterium]
MQDEGHPITDEVIELSFHFLPPARQGEVDSVIRALQADPQFEFMLTVLEIEVNGRRLSPETPPSQALMRKLLEALDEEDGEVMLYGSPYNQLGDPARAELNEELQRIEWWSFEVADRLCRFPELRSLRMFLEHGTGRGAGRSAQEARELHDRLLHGLVGDSQSFGIWGCTNVRGFDPPRDPAAEPEQSSCGLWPAADVSPWFHGVFWDDLLFVLNPPESTLAVLAITSNWSRI